MANENFADSSVANSFKDTDIIEPLEANVNINAIRLAAGHTDTSTTNKYLGQLDDYMLKRVREAKFAM